ncbi:MAG: flavodoxin family protein [Candidatus Heimdallarchaeota archaeon]
MKSLVIYYSKTGNTKLMGETIAKELKADLLELQPEKDLPAKGFGLYFKGGFQSMTKKKVKLATIETSFDDYELIFLGTPVWAWKLNPVVRSFLKANNFTGKKIALFCTCAGNCTKILAEMNSILSDENELLGEIEFVEPLKSETEEKVEQMKNWAKEIHSKSKR